MTSSSRLSEVAQAAARAGGEVLRRYWGNLAPSEISEKGRNDFVSVADRASEKAVLSVILEEFPDDAVLGEEGGGREGSSGREWVIDPLDGTSNFVSGFPFWCVSVGVREGSRGLAGAVWDPLRGEMFHAARGEGSFRGDERISVSDRASARGAFLATGFPFRARDLIDPYLDLFRTLFLEARAIRRAGAAALDLAYVAAGVFDGFFEFRLSPWDILAGAILVEEAGGRVADFSGGAAYLESGDVIAGTPGVVDSVVAAATSTLRR